jgi:hypothetical protein
MKIIDGKIYIIENYISKDTCDFLVSSLKNDLIQSPRELYFTSQINLGVLEAYQVRPSNPVKPYTDDKNKNISIDIVTLLCQMMSKTISDLYKEEYILKTICYQMMLEGARNTMHADNLYYNKNGEVIERETEKKDRSGLLYLDENYEGGSLYFPKQNFTLSPKAGMFVFFEGNDDVVHEVLPITKGTRTNIVSFFWPVENAGKDIPVVPNEDEMIFPVSN